MVGQVMVQLPPRDPARQARKPSSDKIKGRASSRVKYLRCGWVTEAETRPKLFQYVWRRVGLPKYGAVDAGGCSCVRRMKQQPPVQRYSWVGLLQQPRGQPREPGRGVEA